MSDRQDPPADEVEERENREDMRLVARFQAGDNEAYSKLYTRWLDRVFGYMKLVFHQKEDSEDATQQVFANAFEALPRFEARSGSPFAAWLYTIVRRVAYDELKRRGKVEVVDPAELAEEAGTSPPPEEELGGLGLDPLKWINDGELLMFVERLPLAQRQVLALRFVLDLPGAEIAGILGRTHEDVRTLESRAVRRLRDRLIAIGRIPTDRNEDKMRAPLVQARVARRRRSALLHDLPGLQR